MKPNIILTFFICFLLLVFATSVYAFSFENIVSWVSNIFGRITGYATYPEETATTTTTSRSPCSYECCLKDSTYEEKLCSGPKICKDYKCIDIETTTTQITTTTITAVKEKVKCVFINSNTEQKCFTSDWKFACRGLGSCTTEVSGEQGIKLTWKSGCGGEVYTAIDGNDDTVEFKCEQVQTTTTFQAETITTTLSPCPYECCSVKDLVYQGKECGYPKSCIQNKCTETTTTQIIPCTDSDGGKNYYVKGTVKNQYSEKTDYCISEKELIEYMCQDSGIYISAPIPCSNGCKDGACLPETIPIYTGATQPTTYMKEQVTCLFSYSSSMQKCYTDDGKFGCAGVGSCIVEVSGNYGMKLAWKSSCGGYASTIIDENNGYANFDCRQTDTTSTVISSTSSVNEQVKCIFVNSDSTQKCYTESFGCSGTGTCVVDVSGEKGRMLTWKSSCYGYAYTVLDGTNDYAEFNCLQTAQPIVQTPAVPVEHIKEQVWCVFLDSKVLSNPHTATEECYSDVGIGCKWDGNVAEEGGKRYAYCVATIAGERGRKVTWKSSCGGYAYSVMDGEEEKVTFQCIPETDVTSEQIVGKGFKKASWECYDGTEQIPAAGVTVQCQPYEYWKELAIKTCADRCRTYEDVTKCGVNSLSLTEECYIEYGKEGVTFIPHFEQTEEVRKEKIAMPPDSKVGDLLLVLFYKDNCPYCSGMDEELDKVSSQLGINIMKINADEKPSVVMGYGIVGFPSFILLEYTSDGIKEYMISGRTSSSALIEWINKIKSHATVQTEKPKEEIPLICKDTCPLEGKCYPFGYRKAEKYCSDEGAFKEQLKEDSVCENNFECSSNVCVNDKCVSPDLIQKIIDWFKGLFG